MCIQNTLQQHILDITNGGKDIADFFYATMQGRTSNAQTHHQMDAAKQLRKLGLPTTPSPSTGEDWDGGESSARPEPVEGHTEDEQPTENCELITENSQLITESDIINYEVAALIREETNDGYFIADFLARVMRGTAGQGRPVSDADRMRAALELMNRGLGRFGDTRDRRISDSQDELIHSGLSRYIRERTDNGLHAARFLLDVASGQEQTFSMHQRVVATRELVRRSWDTNYDVVTPEDIAAYRERQDALEPTEYDIRLQEWRENELAAQELREAQPVGATGRSPEDEPLPEPGLFAHLSFAEIDRYEAMSAEEQQEFVERQRQLRATRRSVPSVISALSSLSLRERVRVREDIVTPEREETHKPDTPDDLNPPDQPETTDEPGEDHENTDRNTLIQEIGAPSRTPHPVRSESLTHIRSP